MLDRRYCGPRNIAADKSRNGPHHYGHGDNDGRENKHALNHRRVQPNAVVIIFAVIVVVAHRSRLILPRRVFQQFPDRRSTTSAIWRRTSRMPSGMR
jgi:hypothetical protein